MFYQRYGKRTLDLLISLLAIVLFAPLLGTVALLVRVSSPGPVFFLQDRLGMGGKVFSVIKFRTMVDLPRTPDREIIGLDPEVTRFGYWLRRFKLDELPQLVNIIKGDMSLVGPRPALPNQLAEYDDRTRQRLAVRPGLTGLAQINGNIHLSWPERWQYDVFYVNNLSFWLDLFIMLRTLAVVVFGEKRFRKRPNTKMEQTS